MREYYPWETRLGKAIRLISIQQREQYQGLLMKPKSLHRGQTDPQNTGRMRLSIKVKMAFCNARCSGSYDW